MGLDTVELVMALEAEFGIEIPNEHAATLETVGAISSYIANRLAIAGEYPDAGAIWERVKAVVVRQLGVKPADVTPAASIVRDLGAD